MKNCAKIFSQYILIIFIYSSFYQHITFQQLHKFIKTDMQSSQLKSSNNNPQSSNLQSGAKIGNKSGSHSKSVVLIKPKQQQQKIKIVKLQPKKRLELNLSQIHNKIYQSIISGTTEVKQDSKTIQYQKKQQLQAESITLRQKLDQLNEELLGMRNSLLQQKEQEKKYHEEKKKQAIQLIKRLHKDKIEFKKKNKIQYVQRRAKSKAQEEVIINNMRAEVQRRLQEKKKQLSQRVQSIIKRKQQRQQQFITKDLQYRQHMKSLIGKRSTSSPVLPKIILNNEVGDDKKNNMRIDWEGIKKHGSQYDLKKENLLLYMKNKNSEFSLPKLPSNRTKLDNNLQILKTPKKKTRQQIIQQGNLMLKQSLKIIKANPQSSRNSESILAIADNKQVREIGNRYLKQSLLKIDKNKHQQKIKNIPLQSLPSKRIPSIPSSSDVIDLQQTIQLKGNYLPMVRNQQLEIFQKKWNNLIQQMKTHKIDKMKGLQLLTIVENKLNKLDEKGVADRLRKKLQILSSLDGIKQQKVSMKISTQKQGKQINSVSGQIQENLDMDDAKTVNQS